MINRPSKKTELRLLGRREISTVFLHFTKGCLRWNSFCLLLEAVLLSSFNFLMTFAIMCFVWFCFVLFFPQDGLFQFYPKFCCFSDWVELAGCVSGDPVEISREAKFRSKFRFDLALFLLICIYLYLFIYLYLIIIYLFVNFWYFWISSFTVKFHIFFNCEHYWHKVKCFISFLLLAKSKSDSKIVVSTVEGETEEVDEVSPFCIGDLGDDLRLTSESLKTDPWPSKEDEYGIPFDDSNDEEKSVSHLSK